jgi:hypothetical protein
MVKQILPGRRDRSIKRRSEYLEEKMKGPITRFLNVFERHYSEAERRGEVKPIEEGSEFDLKYYLDWYNEGGFEVEEEDQSELPMYTWSLWYRIING